MPPKSDIIVVHRTLNSKGTLRLLIISPVHGWVSEKLVEHVFKIPDHHGDHWAKVAKKEKIRVKEEQLWKKPKGPKIPHSMAISRTLAYYNTVALKLKADPPVEVSDPMRDMSPAGELLFKSLRSNKMKRSSAIMKMAQGKHHGGLRLLELGCGADRGGTLQGASPSRLTSPREESLEPEQHESQTQTSRTHEERRPLTPTSDE